MTNLCRLNQDNPHFSAFERHADWLQANCPGFVKNLKIYIFERTGLSGCHAGKSWVDELKTALQTIWELGKSCYKNTLTRQWRTSSSDGCGCHQWRSLRASAVTLSISKSASSSHHQQTGSFHSHQQTTGEDYAWNAKKWGLYRVTTA